MHGGTPGPHLGPLVRGGGKFFNLDAIFVICALISAVARLSGVYLCKVTVIEMKCVCVHIWGRGRGTGGGTGGGWQHKPFLRTVPN